MPWYRTGTVSVTLNSNAVIGAGTSFVANSRVGDAFLGPDGGWYEITNIASDTALSIAPNYRGTTSASGVYALTPVQGYTKDLADQARVMIQQWGATLAGLGSVSTENIVPVTKGGTGANTVPGARSNLGLGSAAVSSIVGTVSQSGGVPAGAIMERGSNSNGDYIKYADGTMLCWFAGGLSTTTVAAGAIFIASTTTSFTYPSAFYGFPRVIDASLFDHPLNGVAGSARGWGVPFSATKTTCQIAIYGHSSNSSVWPGYVAIGRWF